MLKCGAAEVVITPELGTPIPGYFDTRHATGVKDDLYAHAIVLDDGETTLALISMDIIAVSDKMTAIVRDRLNAATGIPKTNIMVAATHSHTAAAIDFPLYYTEADETVAYYACQKAADAAKMAFDRLAPAKLGYGKGQEYDLGFNRRFILKDGTVKTNPGYDTSILERNAGPIDPDVGVIRVDNIDGSPLAVVVNFTCHLDVVSGTEFCADYPGEMRQVVRAVVGDIPVIFFNGCCGDINHLDFWGKHPCERPAHYKKMGRILGGDVIAIREKIIPTDDIKLGAASKVITGNRRQPTAEDIAESKAYLEANPTFAPTSARAYAEAYIDLSENPILTKDFEVQTLHIGDIGIAAVPSETFVEIGLEIKERSKFENNMAVELANGCLGYVATPLALSQKGGYETKLSRYTYMESDTATKIIETAVELMNNL